MSHTGLVLSTLANGFHSDLWEHYNLVLLPNPDTTNTNNMGLTPAMSWLGAQIRWGTVTVHGPRILGFPAGNSSPHGPYAREEKRGWEKLKLFTEGTLQVDTFHHSDLERTSYHHWAIVGADSLSGTVSLHGDVVVFPGATLTIKAGTTIEFPSQSDLHQFKEGNNRLSEIFVYGTLLSEGTSSNPVALGGTEGKIERWGGIRELGSGSVNLGDYTAVRNTRPVKPAFVRNSSLLSPVAVAVEWEKDYWLSVRAVNKTPFDPGDVYWASDPLEVKVTTLGTEDPGAVVLEPTSPRVGQAVTATLTDEDGYIAGSVWTWEHRLVGGTRWTWQHEGDTPGEWIVVWPLGASGASAGAELSSYTPQAADGGRRLRARVVYQDGASTDGNDPKQAASAPSAAVNRPPVASGPQAVSFAEHTLDWVATYTATDPDGDPLSRWSWAGADSAAFLVDVGAGQVAFAAVPDYEQPIDADGRNTYEVAMIASDGGLADTLAVVVTVVNIEEAGAVALSAAAAPRVGQPITATLTDPDGGITGAAWQWQRRAAATDPCVGDHRWRSVAMGRRQPSSEPFKSNGGPRTFLGCCERPLSMS